jgi:hypothetical protein
VVPVLLLTKNLRLEFLYFAKHFLQLYLQFWGQVMGRRREKTNEHSLLDLGSTGYLIGKKGCSLVRVEHLYLASVVTLKHK